MGGRAEGSPENFEFRMELSVVLHPRADVVAISPHFSSNKLHLSVVANWPQNGSLEVPQGLQESLENTARASWIANELVLAVDERLISTHAC